MAKASVAKRPAARGAPSRVAERRPASKGARSIKARGTIAKRPAAAGSQTKAILAKEKPSLKRQAAQGSTLARNKRGRAVGEKAVRRAKQKGTLLINRGTGTMPVDAPAPFGGTRYTLLTDSRGAKVKYVAAHSGEHNNDGVLEFPDCPSFRPTLTPAQCIREGIFGGCYFHPQGGKPGIFGRDVAIDHLDFPKAWFSGVSETLYLSRRYNIPTNKFKVKSGQDQAFWETKGWIHEQDPRGWFQWYCRFFQGRRSTDDERQIKRWEACAGPRGRWRSQLCGRIRKESAKYDDPKVAPVIRQTLLHWAYLLSDLDWEDWSSRQH